MERGDFASAQAYFAQLADLHPADVDLLVDACECALLAGDRAGALRYFERASARAPEDPALKALRPRVEAAREAEEGTR
jgi:Flp pilus assembly protein TadD